MKNSNLFVGVSTDSDNFFEELEAQERNAYANNPMHELLKGYEPRKMPDLREIMEGTIVGKGKKEYFVSIPGIGSDAFLPFNEATGDLTIGQTISVYIDAVAEKSDEGMYLSQKKAVAWMELNDAKTENVTLDATVRGSVLRGGHIQGLKVVCNTVGGFIPRSHFGRELQTTQNLIGETIPVKVLKVNSNGSFGGDLVLSHRLASNEMQDAILSSIQKDDVLKGTVTKIVTTRDGSHEIGALVSLAPSNFVGFLHASEISDFRGTKPSAVLTPGQEINVQVIAVDRGKREVKVTYKGLLTQRALAGLKQHDVVQGTVLRFKQRIGYFVSIGDGFTALLPCSRVMERQTAQVGNMFKTGEKIEVMILELDLKANRAVVSYKENAFKSLETEVTYNGVVSKQLPHVGLFVVCKGVEGLLHYSELKNGENLDSFAEGAAIKVVLKRISESKGRNLIAWSRKGISE